MNNNAANDDGWMLAWVSLIHAATHLRAGLEDALRDNAGVSLSEQDLLKQLAVNPNGLTHTELARRIFFSKAGITKMLDRLAAQGLVKRIADPDDRRALRVVLTKKGRATWERSRAALKSYLEEHFRAHLSDRDVAMLQRPLRKLLDGHDRWDGQANHLRGAAHDGGRDSEPSARKAKRRAR